MPRRTIRGETLHNFSLPGRQVSQSNRGFILDIQVPGAAEAPWSGEHRESNALDTGR